MTERSDRLIVVSATEAEANHLPDGPEVVITGMGKTAAAVVVTHALAVRAASSRGLEGVEVVNLGTAGALREGLSGLFLPGSVLNHDVNADVIRAIGGDIPDRLDIAGGDHTVLASGDLFVSEEVARSRLAARADLVDMEGYAVAVACARFEVPVRLVKHVSDNADAAALDWPSLVDASARVLGSWLEDYLST